MPVKYGRGYKYKCDRLVSLIIRAKGKCERCGITCPCPDFPNAHHKACKLTTSHIVSRTYSGTRVDPTNLQCLCYSCHMYFTNWPKEFATWIDESVGAPHYQILKARAKNISHKINWRNEYIKLIPIAQELNIKVDFMPYLPVE